MCHRFGPLFEMSRPRGTFEEPADLVQKVVMVGKGSGLNDSLPP